MYLRRRLETGIVYNDDRTHIGFISEFEEREACLKSGYRWEEWIEMSTEDRSYHVAFHRARMLVSAHSEEAVQSEQERQMKRSQKKHGS